MRLNAQNKPDISEWLIELVNHNIVQFVDGFQPLAYHSKNAVLSVQEVKIIRQRDEELTSKHIMSIIYERDRSFSPMFHLDQALVRKVAGFISI